MALHTNHQVSYSSSTFGCKKFEHARRLDSQKEEIRLCSLIEGSGSQKVSCRMRTTTLEGAKPYECLSYVWGETKTTTLPTIYVNGGYCEVTPNLEKALKDLRTWKCSGSLWIDAICLNQKDDKEMGEQVANMASIYENAANVLVWLGPNPVSWACHEHEDTIGGAEENEADIDAAVKFMERLAANEHFHELPEFKSCTAPRCPGPRELASCTRPWKITLQAFRELMEAQWFTRTWTIQEIVLASNATFVYNGTSISWQMVQKAWIRFNAHLNSCCGECITTLPGQEFEILRQFASRVTDILFAKHSRYEGESLLIPLLRFRSRDAKELRDKIYGLLGLQSGEGAIPIDPTYSAHVTDAMVFTDFASSLIKKQGYLVPLHLDLRRNRAIDLPSWVPDWSFYTDDPPDYAIAQLAALSQYDSSKFLPAEQVVPKGKILELCGIEIDRIESVSPPYRLTDSPAAEIDQIQDWLDFMEEAYKGDA